MQHHECDGERQCTLLQEATAKIDEYARGMISGSGSTLFEELGLYYIGPIDGHNLDLIIAMLQGVSPSCLTSNVRTKQMPHLSLHQSCCDTRIASLCGVLHQPALLNTTLGTRCSCTFMCYCLMPGFSMHWPGFEQMADDPMLTVQR